MSSVLSRIKNRSLLLLTNLGGWRTAEKLVVLESDDWGSIRMPDRRTFDRLSRAGIPVDRCRYDCLDTLENQADFESLMGVIDDHRGTEGEPPTFTFNTVMGNPDFDAIKRDGFERFHHQHFLDSYRHYHGQDLTESWRHAIDRRLVRPQFHGREHVNISLWLNDLRAGHPETRLAFDHNFFGLTTQTSSIRQKNYLAACWAESHAELEIMRTAIRDGIALFEDTFGFTPKTFIPCNYILPQELETYLAGFGVTLIQGQRGQLVPRLDQREPAVRRAYTGKRNLAGQFYSVRNVHFEPFEDPTRDWVGSAMREIGEAFLFRKPAIVSTHRVNYVSGMNVANRDSNLRLLSALLKQIQRRWPDARFVTSDELAARMTG